MKNLIYTFISAIFSFSYNIFSDNESGYYTGIGAEPEVKTDIKQDDIDKALNTDEKKDEEPEDKKDENTEEKKDEKPDDKPYKFLDKALSKNEIIPQVKEYFPDINFDNLDEAKQEDYIQKYINASLGSNRDKWQKSNTEKSQELAKLNDSLTEKENKLKNWEETLIRRTVEANKNSKIDISTISDDNIEEKMNAVNAKNKATQELQKIELEKAEILSAKNALRFEKEFVKLVTEFPENFNFSSLDIVKTLKEFSEGKPGIDLNEIAKIYETIDLINASSEQNIPPIRFFQSFGYKFPKLYNAEGLKNKSEEDKAKSKADEIKKEQEKSLSNSSSTNMSSNRNTEGNIFSTAGKTREEFLDTINTGNWK